MRVAIVSIVVVGCSYDPSVGGGDDTPGEDTITIKDDTEADFAASTELADGVLTPEGTIEPQAFILGGLRARAFKTKLVDGTATSFDLLDANALTTPPVGTGYAQLFDNWGSERPLGLSLGANDNFTIYYDGEIELAAGSNVIDMDADDAGILEVTIEGTPHFLLDATSGRKSMTVDVPAAGWYPFRVAIGEGSGNARLSVQLGGVEVGIRKVRAPVTKRTGLVAHLYELGHTTLIGTAGVDGFDGAFGQLAPPYDLRTPAGGNYELRMVGQLHVEVAGSWTFQLVPDDQDSARLWIDETHVATKFPDGLTDGLPDTVTLDLGVGWHDIFLDFSVTQTNPITGGLQLHDATIQLLATPPGGTAQSIKGTELRPVVSSGLASAVMDSGPFRLDDGQTTDVPITIPNAPTRIHSLEAGYVMAGTPADFTVVLDAAGTTIPIEPLAGALGVGIAFDNIDLRGDAMPAVPWTMKFTDNVNGNGDIDALLVFVDLVTRGGPVMPFAPAVVYTSRPHPTPDALRLDQVRVLGAFDDATITVEVRTAASEAELANATFTAVGVGEVPDVAASAFVQYRVTATSDGWQFPVIDAVELDYVIPE